MIKRTALRNIRYTHDAQEAAVVCYLLNVISLRANFGRELVWQLLGHPQRRPVALNVHALLHRTLGVGDHHHLKCAVKEEEK